MLELDYIASVSYLLEKTPQGKLVPPEAIQASLSLALQRLAREVGDSSEWALGQKEYTVALASGVASLATHTDILIDTIETVSHPTIKDGSPGYLSRIPNGSRADLLMPRTQMVGHYVVEKNAIYASKGVGTWPAAEDIPDDGNLAVVANFVAGLSAVPEQHIDRLVEIGAEIAMTNAQAEKAAA